MAGSGSDRTPPLPDLDGIRTSADLAAILRTLRRRFASRRGHALLTYRELATRTGLSRSAINDYFTGKVLPPTDRFDILLTVFEVASHERPALATARDRVEEHLRIGRSTRASPRRRVPHELPSTVSAFTGRAAELAELDRLADTSAGSETSGVAVVWGTAGVGKTALATHWGQRNRYRFPDGELYLDLQGYHFGRPLDPTDALARMIRGLDGPDARFPDSVEERAAWFRTLLADRKVLVVLDNAVSTEQVRDLLPGNGAFTVVTSRTSLTSLVVRSGARRIDLDLLPHEDAIDLLRAVLGPDRVAAEPDSAVTLVERCAHLPLAVRIAAEHIASRPKLSLGALVRELEEEPLDLFDFVGDDHTAPRVVFSWSYRHLPDHAATAFRRLGLHPGQDLDPSSVAALCGIDSATARRTLRLLVSASMVSEPDHDRFVVHDLLRSYAAELALREDAAVVRAAMTRLIKHYGGVARSAAELAFPTTQSRMPLVELTAPTASFEAQAHAIEWLDRERTTLITLTRYAVEHGLAEFAEAFSGILWYYLNSRRHFTQARTLHDCAVHAARHRGDAVGEALALNHLASVEWMDGNPATAIELLERALGLCENRDPDIAAQTLNGLAVACWMSGQFTRAIPYYRRAVTIGGVFDHFGRFMFGSLYAVYERFGCTEEMYGNLCKAVDLTEESGDHIGEGFGRLHVAVVHQLRGEFDEAAEHYGRALVRGLEAGDQLLLSYARTHTAALHQLRGDHSRAVDELHEALRHSRRIGNKLNEATALIHLAASQRALGHASQALEVLRQAHRLAKDVTDADLEAKALNELGAHLHPTSPEQAHDFHERALAVTLHSGNLFERARAHLGLACCRARLGDTSAEDEHRQVAAALLTRLDMETDHRLTHAGCHAVSPPEGV